MGQIRESDRTRLVGEALRRHPALRRVRATSAAPHKPGREQLLDRPTATRFHDPRPLLLFLDDDQGRQLLDTKTLRQFRVLVHVHVD